MPRWVSTRGQTNLAVGICGRCSIKMPLDKLLSDPNYPGLLVCEKDRDQFDAYRLAPRQPDNIILPFCRPDTPIPTNPEGIIAENGDYFVITEDGEDYLKP